MKYKFTNNKFRNIIVASKKQNLLKHIFIQAPRQKKQKNIFCLVPARNSGFNRNSPKTSINHMQVKLKSSKKPS